ncbi:MFS transporter [Rhizobium oryzicola]|uniref:MFS transporter n=1 Tax=Rhizobium oryzicola TaxID=1232668 RepID=A0ABT8T4B5_9HYPH|nr:MFS transporter [Rhizobium oryzicola]MDO1585436.1 MFS transporter [Rhizobium oryzicola]
MSAPLNSQAVNRNGSRANRPRLAGALAGLSLSMLLSSLGTSIANVALPILSDTFAAPFHEVQWIVLAYLLAITTLIVSAGRLGDIAGRKRLLLSGVAIFTGASMLCGLAPSLWFLIAARTLQGIGAAAMMALTIAVVSATVPKERSGRAMGLLGTMSAIGTALGPSLGGLLISRLGWSFIFMLNIPVGVAAFVLVLYSLPPDPLVERQARVRLDAIGTFLLAGTLTAYCLAMTLGDSHWGRLNAVLLAATCLGAGVFTIVEARTGSPLIRPSALRDISLTASLVANAFVSTVMMATLVVGPFYLARALHLDETQVGLIMAMGPVISIVFGIVAGRLVDRFGAASIAMIGLAAMAAGAVALTILPPSFGVLGYIVAIAILTPGYQLFQTSNNTSVMADVPSDSRGVISGMLTLSRNLGLISGVSVMGAIFAATTGGSSMAVVTPATTTFGMQVTFSFAAALIVSAIGLVFMARINKQKHSVSQVRL